MLTEKVEKALNEQINAEFHSAYLYLSMSNYFSSNGYSGFAAWMRKQYHEEIQHAIRLIDYVINRGGNVKLKSIKDVKTEWSSPLEVFKDTLVHEQTVTSYIYKIIDIVDTEKDYATRNMLNWYVDEQVEEECTAASIVEDIEMAGNEKSAIYLINRELGSRP